MAWWSGLLSSILCRRAFLRCIDWCIGKAGDFLNRHALVQYIMHEMK